MSISYTRQEARLKTTNAALAKDPENASLKDRKVSQQAALAKAEAEYPAKLDRHLRHCSANKTPDSLKRTKKMSKNLRLGIRPDKKPGEK